MALPMEKEQHLLPLLHCGLNTRPAADGVCHLLLLQPEATTVGVQLMTRKQSPSQASHRTRIVLSANLIFVFLDSAQGSGGLAACPIGEEFRLSFEQLSLPWSTP